MPHDITRRAAVITALSPLADAAPAGAQSGAPSMTNDIDPHRHDWAWLAGAWRVRHSRLKQRLAGSTEWEEFDGTCAMTPTMNGLGNMDDNWLDLPGGAYRAMGVRVFNPETRQWSIWWLDERFPQSLGEPVRGGFANGIGEFYGDDVLRDQPIKVRFRWTDIATANPRWEQAFSADNGATWEVNWRMRFSRA